MEHSFVLSLFVVLSLICVSTQSPFCCSSTTEKNTHLKYDDGSWKPLHEVVIFGSEADVLESLKNGADVNLVNGENATALHVAVFNGFGNIVDLLIKNGADINSANIFGKTPLHIAVERGNKSIVNLLVQYGSSVDPVDADGMTAMEYAILGENKNIFQIMRNRFLGIGTTVMPPFLSATKISKVTELRATKTSGTTTTQLSVTDAPETSTTQSSSTKASETATKSFFETVWDEVKKNQLSAIPTGEPNATHHLSLLIENL